MNVLHKALIYGGNASLSVLDTTELVEEAAKIHRLGDDRAEELGGLLTACAYMSGCLKSPKGAVSLTIKPQGAGSASVSGDIDLHIRGYIDGGGEAFMGGVLTVIRDDGFFRPFVGATELVSGNISDNLEKYFEESEQIPTLVAIGAKVKGGKCLAAGGVIIQLMPGHTQSDVDRAREVMRNFSDVCAVIKSRGADGILNDFFSAELLKGASYTYFPEYKCNCSRKKIEGVVLPLGKEELNKIIDEEGAVKVHCHYCNTDYVFTRGDIDNLFK